MNSFFASRTKSLQVLRRPATHRCWRGKRLGWEQRQQRRKFFWFATTQEVDNTGSIARDILATERTFLAWARTGLGFVGAGSALAAAYHRQEETKVQSSRSLSPAITSAAALLIANGAFLLLFATRRYYTVLNALRRDKFLINTHDTLGAVILTSVNTILSLGIVWNVELNDKPRNKETSE